MIDVMPTLLAAAGGAPDAAWKVDGANVLDVLQGKAKAPDRTLFWEWQAAPWNMKAAMRGDFKLLDIGGNQFLYNIPADPRRAPHGGRRAPGDLQAAPGGIEGLAGYGSAAVGVSGRDLQVAAPGVAQAEPQRERCGHSIRLCHNTAMLRMLLALSLQFNGWPPMPQDAADLLVKGDVQGSLAVLNASAEGGDAVAMFWLGRWYEEVQGVPHDYAQAMRWYREARRS